MKNLKDNNHVLIKAFVAFVLIGSTSPLWSSPFIEKRDSPGGRVDSVRIEKYSVQGRIWRVAPYQTTFGAHVHVSLVDSKGKTIAWGIDRLPVLLPKDDSGRKYSSYKVTFNKEILGSYLIRVKYVPCSHSRCETHVS